jgi:Tol biopolymer transport system component
MRHLPTRYIRTSHRPHPMIAVLGILTLLGALVIAAPAYASFPGPNGKIVFMDANTGQLWTVNPDGRALQQITHAAPAFVTRPDWSPDGRHITASVTSDFQTFALSVMDADGGHLHQVFTDPKLFGDIFPRYFPTGHRLLFSRCNNGQGCQVAAVNVDGTHEQDLTPLTDGVFDFGPAISPDGRWIVFPRFYADDRPGQLELIPASGGTPTVIPVPPALQGASAPDWTPDGQYILLANTVSSGGTALFRVHADGTGAKQLTTPVGGHSDGQPSVAPQGNRIAYNSDRNHQLDPVNGTPNDLFTANPSGKQQTQVPTPGGLWVEDPDWGPAR